MRQTVALSLLNQTSATERLQGISYSTGVTNPRPQTLEALVQTLDSDPNPNVRLAAVEALYLFRSRPGIKDSLVRSLAIQDSPIVQVALIDLLVEIRDARAAAALEALIKNDKLNPDVKKLAEQGIKQLL
jgi:HEAT repeat protein